MGDVRTAKLGTCLHYVVLLDFALLVEVEVLEYLLHLLKEAAVHKDSANTAQKLVEVDVFFAPFVQKGLHTSNDFSWVFKAEHLYQFQKVKALDTT